jgi:16S rRNA (adenine1518-N6/adenine1519-N6)-dimethyltransferase
MTANPSTPEYGSLTVFLHYYAEPHYAFTVSRNCFYPVPSVDSAVVVLKVKKGALSGNEEVKFFEMTRTAFKHRRKMLRASLKELYPSVQVEAALKEIGKDPQARPEELSLEAFLALFAVLQ